MDNFNLRKFLIENKLTPSSKNLKEARGAFNNLGMSYEELQAIQDRPGSDVTGEYLKAKGIDLDLDQDGIGYMLVDALNAKHVASFPAEYPEDTYVEFYEVYDLGDGHVISLEDYTGRGAIFRIK